MFRPPPVDPTSTTTLLETIETTITSTTLLTSTLEATTTFETDYTTVTSAATEVLTTATEPTVVYDTEIADVTLTSVVEETSTTSTTLVATETETSLVFTITDLETSTITATTSVEATATTTETISCATVTQAFYLQGTAGDYDGQFVRLDPAEGPMASYVKFTDNMGEAATFVFDNTGGLYAPDFGQVAAYPPGLTPNYILAIRPDLVAEFGGAEVLVCANTPDGQAPESKGTIRSNVPLLPFFVACDDGVLWLSGDPAPQYCNNPVPQTLNYTVID